jgi:DNA repair protein RecN (Recombination protein N)
MLSALRIQNFALIHQLDLAVPAGFTVMTGETGAGKSILLGALQLALGGRADVQALALDGEKCVVEADFHLSDAWKTFFDEEDLDFQALTTLRREISAAGKSRAFINDTPVRLETLKMLSEQLIDIHSQRDTAFLTNPSFFPEFLDEYGGLQDVRAAYAAAWGHLQKAEKELRAAKSAFGSDFDPSYTQFLFEELQAAQLKVGEEEVCQEELRSFTHAEAIQEAYAEARGLLEGDERAVVHTIGQLKSVMDRLAKHSDRFASLQEEARLLDEQGQTLLRALENLADSLDVDPGRQQYLEERLSLIDQLQRKHRLQTVEELLALQAELGTQLDDFSSVEERITAAEKARAEADKAVIKGASLWHDARMTVLPRVLEEAHSLLKHLNLADARLAIDVEALEAPTAKGGQRYHVLFSANPGAVPLPLGKVASGGERNRLMLALKALFAQGKGLQTLLFDEIDAGVSGGTAAKVAELFTSMSQHVQVIAITHLPQVAAAGKAHWRVEKEVASGKTSTRLRTLQATERVDEVARLLAGEVITETARAQALSLLKS